MVVTRRKRGGGVKVKGDKSMVTEDDFTLGGGHTTQYADDV